MAPAHGFEPWTKWLTATYSTAELCRSVVFLNISPQKVFSSKFFEFFCFFVKNPVDTVPLLALFLFFADCIFLKADYIMIQRIYMKKNLLILRFAGL